MESNFCPAAWNHLHISPNGDVLPCCLHNGADRFSFGNINRDCIEGIWNGTRAKEFRRSFLNNEQHPNCHLCWEAESHGLESYRSAMNHWTKNNSEVYKEESEFKIFYFDIRPRNLCNFSCIMCSDIFSYKAGMFKREIHNNYAEYPIQKIRKYDDWNVIFNLYKRNLVTMQRIYFAGGEPLIMPEHLQVLNLLIEENKTDVDLYYNTNCSIFTFKGTYFPDIWKKFRSIEINASIDGEGKTVEYIRNGSDWDVLYSNLKTLTEYPNIEISFNIVTMCFNINNIPKLINIIEELLGYKPRITFTPVDDVDFPIMFVPKDFIDRDAWVDLKSRGYECQHIIKEIDSTKIPTQVKMKYLIYFMERYKEMTGKDARDIITWYDEVEKNVENNSYLD